MSKVILYIATSVDGYIAKVDGSLDWLKKFEGGTDDHGYSDLIAGTGAIIMGSRTYMQVLGFGADDLGAIPTYIVSRQSDLPLPKNLASFQPELGKREPTSATPSELSESNKNYPGSAPLISFYEGPLKDLVEDIRADLLVAANSVDPDVEGLENNDQRSPSVKNIWLVGGSDIISQFLELELIDEIIVSIIPIILGSGIPLFKNSEKTSDLRLRGVMQYDTGIVQLHYHF